MRSTPPGKRPRWLIAMLLAAAFHAPLALASLSFYADKPTFQTAAPGLTTEDFESTGTFDPGYYIVCSDPYDYFTNDNCWSPGDIVPGLTIGSSSGIGTVVLESAYYGTPSIVTGAASFDDATEIGFPAGTLAAGMDLVAASPEAFTIAVYGTNDLLLGSTTAQGDSNGRFFGVTSTQAIKRIELTSLDDTLVDNVSFLAPLPGTIADVSVDIVPLESPSGTFTYTVTINNQGPGTASGIATSVTIPSGLAYVSNDCGAAAATSPWAWNIASLTNGASTVCHIVTTVVNPRGVVVNATVATSGTLDMHSQNNTASANGPTADVGIAITGTESPPGTMMYTVTVTNSGPDTALDTVATFSVDAPSALTYLSDDCGGSNSLEPWTWNISSLVSGNNVVCHVFATVVQPRGLFTYARILSTGVIDLNSANDVMGIGNSPTGTGPETPAEGIALFRSFYNLPFKDETGASFSLRDNADKVILLQICAQWCPACRAWTQQGTQLKQSVDQAIGAGNFLDVDILVQDSHYLPSTQADAMDWKTSHSFPGPVLHSEGTATSATWQLDTDRYAQYAAVPGGHSFYPEFYILAPGCNNQIAVRVDQNVYDPPQLGEATPVSTDSTDQMASLIAKVWNDRPCAKPVLHRLDRCSVGSTQIYSNSQTGDFAEAAEAFSVAAGKREVISSVTAVTDAPILDFTVYADAAGKPGSAVCTSTNRPASSVYSPGVKKIDLDAACTLGPGNYWMALKGHSDVDANFIPTWKGGVLPPDGSYAYRDNAGCTAWNAAGQCLAGQQNAQLCFMLETDVLFSSGFDTSAP